MGTVSRTAGYRDGKGRMRLVLKNGPIEIWCVGDEYFVYGVTMGGDPVVCPSIGMAREVAARR